MQMCTVLAQENVPDDGMRNERPMKKKSPGPDGLSRRKFVCSGELFIKKTEDSFIHRKDIAFSGKSSIMGF